MHKYRYKVYASSIICLVETLDIFLLIISFAWPTNRPKSTHTVCVKRIKSKLQCKLQLISSQIVYIPFQLTLFDTQTHRYTNIQSVPQGQGPSEKQKTQVEPLSRKGLGPNSNLNQFHLIRCHGIHYIIIIPLTQGWIFNECNCRQMVQHNCVK